MNCKLHVTDGKVKYLKWQNGDVVGSDAGADAAYSLLNSGTPEKSDTFKGYPIRVKAQDGSEYHFAGEWMMGSDKDVLSEKRRTKAE